MRAQVERVLTDRLPKGARVWLLGSVVWGGFGTRSDVDIAVSGVSGAPLVALERELIVAAGTEVDIMQIESLPDDFRARIVSEGVAFQAAEAGLRTRLSRPVRELDIDLLNLDERARQTSKNGRTSTARDRGPSSSSWR